MTGISTNHAPPRPGAVQTLILCGGRGTRAYPHTVEVPKPLLEVDGRPILDHVIGLYARQGFVDFILAAGYLSHLIEEFAATLPPQLRVEVVDTGVDTGTGARIARCRDRIRGPFFATYADGLGDVDLHELLRFHRGHRGAATLTTVPLPSQYGTVVFDGDGRVERFREKPVLPDHRINAGFFVFEPGALDLWEGDDLEREVLPALAARGELYGYRHDGFWKSMDTYKDALDLSALAGAGRPPWIRAADDDLSSTG